MLAVVLQERHTETVADLLSRWAEEGVKLHSPLLAHYEIANTLTRNRFDGDLSKAGTDEALIAISDIDVNYHTTPNKARSIEIAADLRRRSASDAVYLELAERLKLDMWTLDGPLFRNAGDRYRVKLID